MALVSALGAELARLRRLKGETQGAVARAIGLNAPSQISDWEAGRRAVSREHFEALAAHFEVSVEHLRRFGDPYDPSAPRIQKRDMAGPRGAFKNADDVRGALGMVRTGAASAEQIPLITEAQAGHGRMVYDDPVSLSAESDRTVPRPAGLRDPRAFAVLVQGDSMVPIYRPGHYVVVSPAARVSPGDEVFVALANGERVVKIAHPADGGYVLESANPAYPPRVVYREDIAVMFPIVFSQRKDL